LHDLQSAITTTFATPPGQAPHDTGQTMAFFNVLQRDAMFLKLLADRYTMSDNYHQPVMGGTGPDHIPLGFADQVFFSDGNGNPATPATARIYNPDPDTTAYSSGNFNLYRHPAQWFNCSDPLTQPGVQAILNYLNVLPYPLSPKCDLDHFYPAVNISPAFNPGGTPTDPTNNIPPVTMRSLGDALNEKKIPWKYYGGGYNLAVAGIPKNGYCAICNPFEYQANYPSLRADHMRDVTDLFVDLKNGALPAVS
jgi:phospholipase C